jgi:hypothetical protein
VGKSLVPDNVASACAIEKPEVGAGAAAMDVLRGLRAAVHSAIASRIGNGRAADYSTMKYEELRRIADDDAIAESMSDEEYESLSAVMWKKFGAEKGLR